jgi:hypothetical protein
MARGKKYTETSVSSKATIITFKLNKQRPTTNKPFLLDFGLQRNGFISTSIPLL